MITCKKYNTDCARKNANYARLPFTVRETSFKGMNLQVQKCL